MQGEEQLGRSQFEIIPPLRFGIEIKRSNGQEISARRGVCQVENVLRRQQALIRVRRVTGGEDLVAKCEIGSQAPGKVGADRSARPASGILKDWAMADELIGRATSLEAIVGLRQPPDVVVACIPAAARGNRYLVIESSGAVRPHLL